MIDIGIILNVVIALIAYKLIMKPVFSVVVRRLKGTKILEDAKKDLLDEMEKKKEDLNRY